MYKHKKIKYNPFEKSVPVPILAHSNEVVIPVPVAQRIYSKLQKQKPFDAGIYKSLSHLFSHTPVPVKSKNE
jgi:hypothetical protein